MNFNPRPYQLDAIKGICSKPGFALLLDPGMGKTSSTLAATLLLKRAGEMTAALVVAPIRPCRNVWPAEVQKWDEFRGLRVSLVLGSARERIAALRAPADLYLINPENIDWLAKEVEKDPSLLRADLLIADESTKFKNSQSKRFKALRSLLPRFRRRIILTGTVTPQGIADLWAQICLLDDGARLGKSLTAFRRQYFDERPQYGGFSLWEPKAGADKKVFEKIADLCIRLDAKEHLQMPERVDNRIVVDLPTEAERAYRKMEDDFIVKLGAGVVTAANAAAASMKLRQIANGAVYGEEGAVEPVHFAKLEALSDLIEEQCGQPLLVAVAFEHDVASIRAYLHSTGLELPYLGGGISGKKSDDIIARWNKGEIPVLLAHPASVAHGLNLQAGGHAVAWYGLTWSLEDYVQFNARVWRQGQKSDVVLIHHIVARGTIDEAILEALAGKDARQEKLFDVLKAHYSRGGA